MASSTLIFRSSSTASLVYDQLTNSLRSNRTRTFDSIEASTSQQSDSTDRKPPSKWLRYINLATTSLVLAGFGMCNSMFAPFFPTEAAHRGVSTTVVGLIFGTFTMVMFVGSIVSGHLVRQLGLHFMIGSGTLLAGGATVLFGLLDKAPPGDSYVALCFVVRFIEGIGASVYNTAVFSMVASLFAENIATSYAVLETSFAVGCMLGPTIGGALFSAGGFPLPFYVVGGFLLVLGFFSQGFLRYTFDVEDLPEESDISSSDDSVEVSWVYFFKNSPEIWVITISMGATSVVFNYPEPTMAIFFEELGLDSAVIIGVIFFGASFVYAVVTIVVGKLADSFPEKNYLMMAIGATEVGVTYLLMGPVPFLLPVIPSSVGLTTTMFIVSLIGLGTVISPAPSAILAAAHRVGFEDSLETSSLVAGLYNAIWYFGSSAGMPLGGLLVDSLGFPWGAFVMSMTVFFAALVLFIAIFVARRHGAVAYYRKMEDESDSTALEESSLLSRSSSGVTSTTTAMKGPTQSYHTFSC